ncbi:MAG TPA: PilZ domain-containing protein, partial [Nitrospiraceae bacterium]
TDQRKYPRYVVAFTATIDDGVVVQASKVIDISREGCRIRCTETTPGAKYFRVEIHLAGTSDTLTIDLAVMRWARHGDIGIEFICLSPENQERLRTVIQSCQETAACPEKAGKGSGQVPAGQAEENR